MSSTGMVSNLINRLYWLLYHTMGASIPEPVNIPFTIKKGINKMG